jgi:hypothetical protein
VPVIAGDCPSRSSEYFGLVDRCNPLIGLEALLGYSELLRLLLAYGGVANMFIQMLKGPVAQLIMLALLGFVIGIAVVEWPAMAAIAGVLYILHRVTRSHEAHVRELERDRHSGPLAYIWWLLSP